MELAKQAARCVPQVQVLFMGHVEESGDTMSTDDLKQLVRNKTVIDFANDDQDFAHGLRLVLRNNETGEMGVLAVEPDSVVLPEENLLFYSYQGIETTLPPPTEGLYDFSEPPSVGEEIDLRGDGLFG